MYENSVVPLLGRVRKPRPRTYGIMLDKMSKSLGGARMRISIVEGNRRPHDLSCQVCLRGRCSSQEGSTNFNALERIQEGEARRCLLHKICGKAKCMYGYPLLTYNSALSNFNGFIFIHTTMCREGCTLTMLTHQQKKLARM